MSSAISTRGLRLDNRGVTPIIGFILLFGIGIIAFAGYQATSVPNQNAETEFNHLQQADDEWVEIWSAQQNLRDGEQITETIRLGTRYQQRIFAVNPPPVSGQLRTESTGTLTVGQEEVNLSTLAYRPAYNYIDPPTYYLEHGVGYRTAGDNAVILADNFISGTQLNFIDAAEMTTPQKSGRVGFVMSRSSTESIGEQETIQWDVADESAWEQLLEEKADNPESNIEEWSITAGTIELVGESPWQVRRISMEVESDDDGQLGSVFDFNDPFIDEDAGGGNEEVIVWEANRQVPLTELEVVSQQTSGGNPTIAGEPIEDLPTIEINEITDRYSVTLAGVNQIEELEVILRDENGNERSDDIGNLLD